MNYGAAIGFVFKNPKWIGNLLFCGLCVLVPFVGPVVLLGYCIDVFTALRQNNYASYPDFDTGQLTRYLSRGLYPLLVVLVASLAFMPLFLCCFFSIVLTGPLLLGRGNGGAALFSMCCAEVLFIPLIFLLKLIVAPILLRAIIMQDFAKSFSFAFVRDFLSRVGMQLLGMYVVFFLIGIAGGIVGLCLCGIGIYPVAALLTLVQYYLLAQLYDLYLARGGENLPVKEGGAF